MAADTSVKWLSNSLTGAPALNGTAGSMITLLDAVLVNGFNTQTVDSIVVSGGIATVTRAAGSLPSVRGNSGAYIGTVVTIAGATPAGLNGQKRILTTGYVPGTSFQFDATGISDQTATGTITCTTSGLGWNKVYAGTNIAIYQRTEPTSTGSILYISDTTTSYTTIGMYEVNNQSLLSSNAGYSNGAVGYIPKSSTADTTARAWNIIGDGRGFFIQVNYQASNGNIVSHHCFGDITSVKQNDPYSCFIRVWDANYTGTTTKLMAGSPTGVEYGDLWVAQMHPTMAIGCSYLQRNSMGFGAPSQMRSIWVSPAQYNATVTSQYLYSGSTGNNGSTSTPTSANVPIAPNGADNGLYLVPITLIESANNVYRGTVTGIYAVPQWTPTGYFYNGQTFVGTGNSSGKILLHTTGGSGTSYGTQTYLGSLVYDVSGPWVR